MNRIPRWTWLAVLAATLLAAAAHRGQPLPGDAVVLRLLRMLPPLPVRAVAVVGSEAALAGIAVILAWALRRHLEPLRLLAVMAGALIVERALKILVHRPRPAEGDEGWGFPSGHALFTMTLVVLVAGALWSGLQRRGKRVLASLAIGGVVLVAADRVALGVHWPSDVLGGWLIGLAYGALGLPWVARTQTERHSSRRI